jgi:hypothetical protein
MSTEHGSGSGVVVAAALALLVGAAAFAGPTLAEETKQVGATAIVYRGPKIDVAISYRFIKLNPSGTWFFLDTAMTATAPIEVPRTAISLRTPSGAVVALASQEEFGRAFPGLAGEITRANKTREPMAYLTPRRYRRLAYFTEPGRGLAFPSVWLDEWHNHYGRLFFQLPAGIQPGSYELVIDLHDSRVAIPFTI